MNATTPERSGYDAQNAWAARNGLQESDAQTCPRVVAGLRCIDRPGRHRCICQTDPVRDVFDHTRMWLTTDGRHVLTTEPYKRTGLDRDLNAFTALMSELGLTATVSHDSPWSPGSTVLIAISNATGVLNHAAETAETAELALGRGCAVSAVSAATERTAFTSTADDSIAFDDRLEPRASGVRDLTAPAVIPAPPNGGPNAE